MLLTFLSSLRSATTLVLLAALLGMMAAPNSASAQRKKSRKKTTSSAQSSRSDKEQELRKLQSEIDKLKRELKAHESSERQTAKNITIYNRRTTQLRKAIDGLQEKVKALGAQRAIVDSTITETESTLSGQREAYSAGVQSIYKDHVASPQTEASGYLDVEAHNERLRMTYYAKLVGQAHSLSKQGLDSTHHLLSKNKKAIEQTIEQQQHELSNRASEEDQISEQRRKEAARLAALQKDNAKIKQEINRRMQSAKKLEGIIADLIAKEAERKAAERARRLAASKKRGKSPSAPKEEIREYAGVGPHTLRWPSATHKLLQAFGEHRNSELNTVTVNLGIDIAAPKGSSVSAAAEGSVSLVSYLPGYGNIIILEHGSDLHTVYGNLSSMTVKKGQLIKAGQTIGRSGDNEEFGPLLHFEVWKGRQKQNPVGWLQR